MPPTTSFPLGPNSTTQPPRGLGGDSPYGSGPRPVRPLPHWGSTDWTGPEGALGFGNYTTSIGKSGRPSTADPPERPTVRRSQRLSIRAHEPGSVGLSCQTRRKWHREAPTAPVTERMEWTRTQTAQLTPEPRLLRRVGAPHRLRPPRRRGEQRRRRHLRRHGEQPLRQLRRHGESRPRLRRA